MKIYALLMLIGAIIGSSYLPVRSTAAKKDNATSTDSMPA
jgi:hypothetical protein